MAGIRIALINPPLANLTQPFVALASLQAHLRQNGYQEIQIWDASQTIVSRFLTEEYLADASERLNRLIETFESKAALSLFEAMHYREALSGRIAAEAALPRLTSAVAALKDPDRFFDVATYESSMKAVDLALEAISGLVFPQSLSRTSYEASRLDDLDSEAEIRAFLASPERCLFHAEFVNGILDQICCEEPQILGISATFKDQFLPGLVLAGVLKERLPDSHIVLGGAFVSSRMDSICARPWLFDYVDSIALYEGETPLLALVRAVESGHGLDEVPNLLRRSGGSVVTPARWTTEDMEKLAAPDYTGFDISQYLTPAWDVIYDPTRGCYWNKCTFCAVSLSTRRDVSRTRSASRIVDHIEALCEKHRTNVITFGVDAIPVPLMRSVSEEIVRRRLDVGWSSEFILDKLLDRETIELFAASGCLLLLFGVESASPRIIKLMKKGTVGERSERIIRECREAGIGVLLHLMVGFPSETLEEIEETISFVERMKRSVDIYEINAFGLVEETPILATLEQVGITKVGKLKREFRSWSVIPYQVAGGLPPERIEALVPELGARLDRALGLEGRKYLRQDNAHLHLYLKALGHRPRDLRAPASSSQEDGSQSPRDAAVATLRSGFDLVELNDTLSAIARQHETRVRTTEQDGASLWKEWKGLSFLRKGPFYGLLDAEERRVVRLRRLHELAN